MTNDVGGGPCTTLILAFLVACVLGSLRSSEVAMITGCHRQSWSFDRFDASREVVMRACGHMVVDKKVSTCGKPLFLGSR